MSGRGRLMTWVATCHGESFVCSSEDCTERVGGPSEPAPIEEPEPTPVRRLRFATGSRGEIVAVRASLRSGSALLAFTIGPINTEMVHVALESRTSSPLQHCDGFSFSAGDVVVDGTLAEGSVDLSFDGLSEVLVESRPVARFCGLEWYPTPSDRTYLQQFIDARARIGTGGEETTLAESSASIPENESPEDSLRTQLQESAAVLHACTNTDAPIRVDLTWTTEGVVTLSLPGQEASVVGCAQSAVPLEVPEGAAVGELVHVVR